MSSSLTDRLGARDCHVSGHSLRTISTPAITISASAIRGSFYTNVREWEVRDRDRGKKVGGEEERALRERTTVGSPQPPNGRNGIGMAFLFGDCYHRGVHRTSDQVLDSQKECLSCMQ